LTLQSFALTFVFSTVFEILNSQIKLKTVKTVLILLKKPPINY